MDLKVSRIVVGALETNCYLASINNECFVVDPGDEAKKITKTIGGQTLRFILITHGHYDHLLALNELLAKYPKTKVYIGKKDIDLCYNLSIQSIFVGKRLENLTINFSGLDDGDRIAFGKENIQVLHTPGHTGGGVCYLINNLLFSGDTLFKHSYGRVDLPTGDPKEMEKSLKRLSRLDDQARVLPGHLSETTIGEEKIFGFLA